MAQSFFPDQLPARSLFDNRQRDLREISARCFFLCWLDGFLLCFVRHGGNVSHSRAGFQNQTAGQIPNCTITRILGNGAYLLGIVGMIGGKVKDH